MNKVEVVPFLVRGGVVPHHARHDPDTTTPTAFKSTFRYFWKRGGLAIEYSFGLNRGHLRSSHQRIRLWASLGGCP